MEPKPSLTRRLFPPLPNDQGAPNSLKYFHFAFISILATIAWSEAILWLNNKRLARVAARGGGNHEVDAVIAVITNDTTIDVEQLLRSSLKDSIPRARIMLVDGNLPTREEQKSESTDRSQIWANAAVETCSDNLIKFGVGIYVLQGENLKNAQVTVVDGNVPARQGRCNSVAVPPAFFTSSDIEDAFRKAWKQLF